MGNFDVEKTIVVPDSGGTGNNFLAGMLASACQSKGLDANAQQSAAFAQMISQAVAPFECWHQFS